MNHTPSAATAAPSATIAGPSQPNRVAMRRTLAERGRRGRAARAGCQVLGTGLPPAGGFAWSNGLGRDNPPPPPPAPAPPPPSLDWTSTRRPVAKNTVTLPGSLISITPWPKLG